MKKWSEMGWRKGIKKQAELRGEAMSESGWRLDISWGSDFGGCLSPGPVMLMLVDTVYNPPLFVKSASGPKHYFHFTKDRTTTMEEKRAREESRVAQSVLSLHVSVGFLATDYV